MLGLWGLCRLSWEWGAGRSKSGSAGSLAPTATPGRDASSFCQGFCGSMGEGVLCLWEGGILKGR